MTKNNRTFTLGSLLLLIALIAVAFGIAAISPILGPILAAIFVAFVIATLARTTFVVRESRQMGYELQSEDKIWLFCTSLIALLICGTVAVAPVPIIWWAMWELTGDHGRGPEALADLLVLIVFLFVGAPFGLFIGTATAFFPLRWLWRVLRQTVPPYQHAREKKGNAAQ